MKKSLTLKDYIVDKMVVLENQTKIAQALAAKKNAAQSAQPAVASAIVVPEGQKLQSFPFSEIMLPSDFELTNEEKSLLEIYEQVRQFEREAARLREQQAKAKLAAAEEQFHKKQQAKEKEVDEDEKIDDEVTEDVDMEPEADKSLEPKPKKLSIKIKRPTAKRKRSQEEEVELSQDDENDIDGKDGETESDQDEDDNEDEHDDAEEESFMDKEYRKSMKVKEKKKSKKEDEVAAREEEDRRRDQLLGYGGGDTGAVDSSALLKKKSKGEIALGDVNSLLHAAVSASTPPHDFSKRHGMDNNRDGKVVFPFRGTSEEDMAKGWSPPQDAKRPMDRCLEMDLPEFDAQLMTNKVGRPNNTLGIKFTAPFNSHRFSLNITGPNHTKDLTDVLVHFNPRPKERGGRLIVNDKQGGLWGKAVTLPLKTIPKMFGRHAVTLIIQISAEGFDFFVDNRHCARLDHRTPLPMGQCSLHLHFPSTDDYGSE